MNRRHFLTASAGAIGLSSCRSDPETEIWRGVTMGIKVSVRYRAGKNLENALSKVREAESVLTLWEAESELSRLNREGVLDDPPEVLLDCLEKSRELFEATQGLFDPTVHSFLEWSKTVYQEGGIPDKGDLVKRLALVDFAKVEFSAKRVSLPPGMSLALNAMAQGYLTDVFAENFDAESALVHFGEYRVVGDDSWPVEVGEKRHSLSRSLAVSSGSGQRLSATSAANHLMNPKTGSSPPPKKTVAVEADAAWLADGLSTVVAVGGVIPEEYSSARIL